MTPLQFLLQEALHNKKMKLKMKQITEICKLDNLILILFA